MAELHLNQQVDKLSSWPECEQMLPVKDGKMVKSLKGSYIKPFTSILGKRQVDPLSMNIGWLARHRPSEQIPRKMYKQTKKKFLEPYINLIRRQKSFHKENTKTWSFHRQILLNFQNRGHTKFTRIFSRSRKKKENLWRIPTHSMKPLCLRHWFPNLKELYERG